MVKGCGLKCIKYSLFAFNLVFWLVGCALLAVGIWFLVDSQKFLQYANSSGTNETLILGLGIGVVVVGAIIMITGFLGCCGAIKESECMLAFFFAILLVIFAAMVALGVIFLVQQDWIRNTFLKEIMTYEANNNVSDGLLKWSYDEWGCCGIESTDTCTVTYPPTSVCTIGSTKCQLGCLNALWDNLLVIMTNGAGIALLVTCGVLIFGMVMSLCLCCSVH